MAMIISDNSPSAGYVAWVDAIITYKGTDYNIANGNSNKEFIWWDFDSPTEFQESDTLPTLTDDDAVIIHNRSGSHFLPLTRNIVDGELIRDESITAGKLAAGAASVVGEIKMYPVATPPTGWLICNGAAVSRTTYATLYALIGTTFGVGDGSTTFNLPDLRNRMVVGAGDEYAIAAQGGEKEHTLTQAEMPAHNHGSDGNHRHSTNGHATSYPGSYQASASLADQTGYTNYAGSHAHSTVGSSGAHNNMPPYLGMYFIIKY